MNILPQIVLAQLNPTVGNVSGNIDKIRSVRDNAPGNTEIIIFSEMITTGYPTDDLVLNPNFMDVVEAGVKELAAESSDKPAIIISTPWRENGDLYNVAMVIHDGAIQHMTYKHHLPNYGVFDEKRIFKSGALPNVYEFKGIKLGLMTCEDLWYPDVATHLQSQGADILIVPNGSPYQIGIHETRSQITLDRFKETNLPILYVNQIGGQDELVFDGGSFVIDATGEKTHQFPLFEEYVGALSEPYVAPELSEDEIIYKAATLGLQDYVNKNGFPGVLIGLSGGIDSALSAAIAVDALGAERVHCVMMPSPYTSQDSLDDAAECAELLGVQLDTIPIEEAMKAFENMVSPIIQEHESGTTFENIQSRARGVTLMALSNATGKMVLSTGNKSEMAVGYATLYGDMCGGFNAIKDIYKMQVYSISRWRNDQGQVIPERIITKAPSAELKPDQTDQDTLPPYEVLDDILQHLIEHETRTEDIPHDQETVQRVWKMLKVAEYKRRQAPPGVKITSKAFGRNRRYPITNRF